MIYHQIEDQTHAPGVAGFDEDFDVGDGAIWGVHGFVFRDVVAHVVLRTVIHGREPDHVDAEGRQVVDFRDDAWDIAEPVAVRVQEGGRVDLVTIRPVLASMENSQGLA